jgi:histone demethylase JARID1
VLICWLVCVYPNLSVVFFFCMMTVFFPCNRASIEAGPHTPPASCDKLETVEANKCSNSNSRKKSEVRVDLVKFLRQDSELDKTWRENKKVLHRTARRRSNLL